MQPPWHIPEPSPACQTQTLPLLWVKGNASCPLPPWCFWRGKVSSSSVFWKLPEFCVDRVVVFIGWPRPQWLERVLGEDWLEGLWGQKTRLEGCADDKFYLVIKACAAPWNPLLSSFMQVFSCFHGGRGRWPEHSGPLLHWDRWCSAPHHLSQGPTGAGLLCIGAQGACPPHRDPGAVPPGSGAAGRGWVRTGPLLDPKVPTLPSVMLLPKGGVQSRALKVGRIILGSDERVWEWGGECHWAGKTKH